MGLAVDHTHRYRRPLHKRVGIEITETETLGKQTPYTHIDSLFAEIASLHSLGQMLVYRATLDIGTAYHTKCGSRTGILGHTVALRQIEIVDGSAVAHHHSVKAPFVAEYLLKQTVAAAACLTLKALVGTHHLSHSGVLHKITECREISLPQVARGQILYIEIMTGLLRAAVYCEMFCAGKQFDILPGGVAL